MSSNQHMRPILLKGHERPITQVKYNIDGDLIFSVAKDDTVCLWYSSNGERLGTYHGHKGAIWSLDVDSTTTYMITAGSDFTAKLWKVETGECIFTWDLPAPVKRVEFSHDFKKFFLITDHAMGQKGTVHIFNFNFENPFKQDDEPILKIINEFDNTEKITIATWSYGSKYILAGHDNGKISKINSETGEYLLSEKYFDKTITDIQASEDKSYFIASSKDETAKLIDVDSLNILKEYNSESPVNAALITPIKDYIILGGGQDAKDVTTTSGGEGKFDAKIFHKLFQDEIGNVRGHFGPLNCLSIHPQGTSFVSGGEDGYIRLHHLPKVFFDFQYEVEKTAAAAAAAASTNNTTTTPVV